MNCRNARKLMHEILDGTFTHQARLEAHLTECERCRAQWAMLSRTQDALIQCVGRPVEDSALERLTSSVLAEVGTRETGPPVVPAPRRWVAVAIAAGLLLAFATGLGAGRTIWPREMAVTRVVTEREVVERQVRIEVPVPRERVVVKRVPVLKTNVVYRDRPTREAGAAEEGVVPAPGETLAASPPPKVELVAVNPVLRREIRPAAVVDDGVFDAKPAEPLASSHADFAPDSAAETIMVAQTGTGIAQPTAGEDQ